MGEKDYSITVQSLYLELGDQLWLRWQSRDRWCEHVVLNVYDIGEGQIVSFCHADGVDSAEFPVFDALGGEVELAPELFFLARYSIHEGNTPSELLV